MEMVTAYWLPMSGFCALVEWPFAFLNLVLGALP